MNEDFLSVKNEEDEPREQEENGEEAKQWDINK